MHSNFEELKGKTLTKVEVGDNDINFVCSDGDKFAMYHNQDCCEVVYVEDVCGDLEDIINSEILMAEESSSSKFPPGLDKKDFSQDCSVTWTFYKLSTIKGSITIRWYGSSNGYYSESVDFYEVSN